MKLMLAAMVRNESARIERCLKSVAPWIDSWVIVDTGSTDDTKQKILSFFQGCGIVGGIYDGTFENWAQARNQYLDWVKELERVYEPDMVLLVDADMELVVTDPVTWRKLEKKSAYEMYQKGGCIEYRNTRLWNPEYRAKYHGVTHEYLSVEYGGLVPREVAYFIDHGDGANREGKVKRDIALLEKGLENEPNNERYMFYLGNSYMEDQQYDKARKWYQKRVEFGGWPEEQWHAQFNIAQTYKAEKKSEEYITATLKAYQMRPHRAEPMWDAARYFREQDDKQAIGLMFAEAVEHLPSPCGDGLFVNEYVYDVGVKEEISICANYVPGKMEKGLKACNELSLKKTKHSGARDLARHNLYWYSQPLLSYCPSFSWRELPFTPPEHWSVLNPSVCLHKTALYCNIRAVNYRIDGEGYYLTRRSDTGEWVRFDHDTPITTKNFILNLGGDPFNGVTWTWEARHALPVEWPLVIGHEDMRLFSDGCDLWASATVRQLCADGQCEQVLSRLVPCYMGGKPHIEHTDTQRLLRTPRVTEKNWSPILHTGSEPWEKEFMYMPGQVIKVQDPNTLIWDHPAPWDITHLRGSSQVIPWKDGYLAVVHEANFIPGTQKRWYWHRFIKYSLSYRPLQISLPFVFHAREIEFCAGACVLDNKLILSYGFKDESARIATLDCNEVEDFLCR